MLHHARSLGNKPVPTDVAHPRWQFAARSGSLRAVCSAQRPLRLSASAPSSTPFTNEVQRAGRRHLQLANATSSSNSIWQGIRHKLPNALGFAAAAVAVSLVAPHVAQAATAAAAGEGSSLVKSALSFVLHLDKHLSAMIQQHGTATYAILWTIVFCETGLVLTPFLPGDSLLFAAGAFAGMGQLNLVYLFGIFMTSAVLGDAVNYAIGSKLGRWALDKKMLEQKYINQTEKFYDKYGGKTVVLARFVPIVRTFAPFVAGIGSMTYSKFALYNIVGALIWTVLFLGAGFLFGNLPLVQHNFTLVVLGIVAVSVLPVVLEVLAARKEQTGGGAIGVQQLDY